MWSILLDANTRWVLSGCLLLGLSSGVLGSFAYLRKHSLIGDAMAHAALPGICIAFILYGTKSIALFLVGAAIAGLVASFFINFISAHSRIKPDTSLGLVLSVFFGIGIVLLTRIQHSSQGNQSGLDSFLFGKAASMVGTDVKVMMGVAIVLLLTTLLLFKEFKLLSFDPGFGRGLGLPMGFLNFLLMTLIVASVVIGLQAVGVVLMAAMLITPAISARYWTERLETMIILAGMFGALSGILGTMISTLANGLPTGPLIVLTAACLFFISLVFAPRRGLLAKALRLMKTRQTVARENVLQSLYELTELLWLAGKQLPAHGFMLKEIAARRSQPTRQVRFWLSRLNEEELTEILAEENGMMKGWLLSDKGLEEALRVVQNQRLWDIFLMYESKFAGYKVNRERLDLDRQLPPEAMAELRKLLDSHQEHRNMSLADYRRWHFHSSWRESLPKVKESGGGGLA